MAIRSGKSVAKRLEKRDWNERADGMDVSSHALNGVISLKTVIINLIHTPGTLLTSGRHSFYTQDRNRDVPLI
jgi:hypothetical protein